MKRLSKVSCGLLLTASLLIGAMLSGCGQTTDYTAEIKEYQNKLESLAAENEELKAQLGITETQSTEETQTAAETENQSQEMVSENQTDQTGAQQAENTDNSGDEMKILVLGDSIWGNYRDDTGVSARLTACLAQKGKNALQRFRERTAEIGRRSCLDLRNTRGAAGAPVGTEIPCFI